jgi:hypothetical protein
VGEVSTRTHIDTSPQNTIKKNTETLIDASKEVGLEINIEKSEYMLYCLVIRMQGKIVTEIGNT